MEMSYCFEHGIPHSEFLNWLPEDRAKTLAFFMEQGVKCGMCGTSEWEWEKNNRAYEPVEKFCMGCYLKHMAGEDSAQLPGTTIVLESTKSQKAYERRSRMKREYDGRR